MAKCVFCNKKAKRSCLVLQQEICPSCCGSKRGNEIECTLDCSIYKKSILKDNEKAVIKLAKESFNNEYDDLFKKQGIPETAGPFEEFIFINYYRDLSIDDNDILNCYIKIYYLLQGQDYLYTLEDYELDIFNKFVDVTKENNVPIRLQQVIILRLIKSIKQVSGGRFGRRNYLEMLRGMLTKTGRMADLFKD